MGFPGQRGRRTARHSGMDQLIASRADRATYGKQLGLFIKPSRLLCFQISIVEGWLRQLRKICCVVRKNLLRAKAPAQLEGRLPSLPAGASARTKCFCTTSRPLVTLGRRSERC